MQCPPGEIFYKFLENSITPDHRARFLEHIQNCLPCRQKLHFLLKIKQTFQLFPSNSVSAKISQCLSDQEISAFINNTPATAQLDLMINHLLNCDNCRQKLFTTYDFIHQSDLEPIEIPDYIWNHVSEMGSHSTTAKKPYSFIIQFFIELFNRIQIYFSYFLKYNFVQTALVMGTTILLMIIIDSNVRDDLNIRGTTPSKLTAVAPVADIATFWPEFQWKGFKDCKEYIVELWSDERGKVIWRCCTPKTCVLFPRDAKIKLKCQHTYSWKVKAIDKSGVEFSSNTLNFYITKTVKESPLLPIN